jgi:hypothetical protein
MNEGDITITLTESQHELLLQALSQAQEAVDFAIPFDGLYELPLNSPIVQKYTSLSDLHEMLLQLWVDRFE